MMKLVHQRRTTPEKAIAITMVNQGMLDFTYNWICSVRRFNFSNYVILAADEKTFMSLQAAQEPVVLMSGAFGNEFLTYGTTAYQGLMHIRLLYIQHLLKLDYRVLLFDVDQVWTANPFAFIDKDCGADIHTQDDGTKNPIVCMGFIYLNPTQALLKLWEAVRVEHSIKTRTSVYAERNNEQQLFNALSKTRAHVLRKHYLNRSLFVNGFVYWHHPPTVADQHRHFPPVQIHDNWIIGKRNKLERLVNSRLWMLAPDWNWNSTTPATCDYSNTIVGPLSLANNNINNIAVPPPRLREMVITIKILPSTTTTAAAAATSDASSAAVLKALQQRLTVLVNSLLAADYSAGEFGALVKEARIDLELFRPAPVHGARSNNNNNNNHQQDDALDALYARVLGLLQAKWTSGQVRAVDVPAHVAPNSVEQRLLAWTAESDQEAAVMIDDQQEVSPLWWRWVRYAVGSHFCHLDNYEPRLYGVVLERNLAIVAANRSQQVMTQVSTQRKEQPFYAQNVGYRATLFFPRLWRRFVGWVNEYKAARLEKKTTSGPYPELVAFDYALVHAQAALPTLAGEEPQNRWYVWWLAFTAHLGTVALHPPPAYTTGFVWSQLPSPSTEWGDNNNDGDKEKDNDDRGHAIPFLNLQHPPILPLFETSLACAIDFRGLVWRSAMHLGGIVDEETGHFKSPTPPGARNNIFLLSTEHS